MESRISEHKVAIFIYTWNIGYRVAIFIYRMHHIAAIYGKQGVRTQRGNIYIYMEYRV